MTALLQLASMPKLGDAIKKLRESKYWTQDDLAQKAGVSRATVQNAEAANGMTLSGTTYRKIAEAFGLSPTEFDRQWRSNGTGKATHRGHGGIPIINKTPAGPAHDYEDVGHNHYDHLPILPDAVGDREAFAVEVIGDSMAPTFNDRDIVVCSPGAALGPGDPVFVRFNNSRDGCCTIKRVYEIDRERLELRPDNLSKHKPEIVKREDVVRMAKIVMRCTKF